MSLEEFRQRFEWAVGVTVTLLIAGNAFFIKQLVDGIYETKQEVVALRMDMAVVKSRLGIRTAALRFEPVTLELQSLTGGKNEKTLLAGPVFVVPGYGLRGCRTNGSAVLAPGST